MAALCANAMMAAAVGNGARAGVHVSRCFARSNNSSLGMKLIQNSQCSKRSMMAFTTLSPSSTVSKTRFTSQRNNYLHRYPQRIARSLSIAGESNSNGDDIDVDTSTVDTGEFFANPLTHPTFASLGITSPALLHRLTSPTNLGLSRPSAVQAAVFETISKGDDVIIGAETGSGKTLAYLLPLVEDVLRRKKEWKEKQQTDAGSGGDSIMDPGYDYARAIILVPNKELAHQAVRMAASICGGIDKCVVWGAEGIMTGTRNNNNYASAEGEIPEEEIVRLAVLPGGLSSPQDFPPFRFATTSPSNPSQMRQPPPDLVFATPAALGPMGLSPKNIEFFADVPTLVVDEADMLLDGGYVRELNNALMGFKRADRLVNQYDAFEFERRKSSASSLDDENEEEKDDEEEEDGFFDDYDEKKQQKTQHIFVAATLPNYGLRSVDAHLNRKFPYAKSITMAGMHNARHYGLEEDSTTMWNEIVENKDRMKRLVDVLRLERDETGVDGRGLKGEKVMLFLNSVKDVDGATNGLR